MGLWETNSHLHRHGLVGDLTSLMASSSRGVANNKAPLEILLVRVGLPILVGCILSVVSLPRIIPPADAFVIGMVVIGLSLALPKQLFCIGAIFPTVIAMFLLAMAASSLLLTAAVHSDGLFVAVFGLWALFISSFYFGSFFDKVSGMVPVMIGMSGMLALSLKPMVQEGLTFPLSETQEEILCSLFDCTDDLTFQIIIPEALGLLASGQEATVTLDRQQQQGGSTVSVEGGFWVIRGLWAWHGTENPLAIFRNLLIVLCWAIFIVILSILIPPVRRVRDELSQRLVPGALMQASQLLRDHCQQQKSLRGSKAKEKGEDDREQEEEPPSEEEAGGDTKNEGNEDVSEELITRSNEEEQQQIESFRTLIHLLASMNGGKAASILVFEPRLLQAPTENLAPKLADLMVHATRAILGALIVVTAYTEKDSSNIDSYADSDVLEIADAMTKCAAALSKIDDTGRLVEDNKKSNDDKEATREIAPVAIFLRERADLLSASTKEWINAIQNPEPIDCGKEGWKRLLSIYAPWILAPLLSIVQQFEILVNWFTLKGTSHAVPRGRALLWTLKLVAGYVALFSMSVFWAEYSDFAIELPEGNIGAVYSGWQMISYSFIWQPTLEGTLAKGVARIIGTLVGGFAGWLGAIVCAGSTDESVEMNPYGLVAWLTVTSVACGWVFTEKGTAYAGLNKDTGAFGNYFSATQALIMLDIFIGKGTRNDLVANRTIATFTGCAMAMVLSSLPPYVRGNNPELVRIPLVQCREALRQILQDLLDHDQQPDVISAPKYRESIMEPSAKALRRALFCLKDASALKGLSFLRVDPRLMSFTDDATVGIALLGHILDYSLAMVDSKDSLNPDAHSRLQDILEGLDQDVSDAMLSSSKVESSSRALSFLVSTSIALDKHLRNSLQRLDNQSPGNPEAK